MSMKHYKSAAKASQVKKLKAMGCYADGGPVPWISPRITPVPPVTIPTVSFKTRPFVPMKPLPMNTLPMKTFAAGGDVASRGHQSPVIVTRGAAAAREMAQMKKKVKAAGKQSHLKKG